MKPKQPALFTETFDSKSHQLQDFSFTLDLDQVGFTVLDEKKRTCKMRYLRGGEPPMADSRKFRMLPEDCAVLVGNCKKRLSTFGIPQLTEHGWGKDGGKGCGKHLDVLEEGGDIWNVVILTEEAWADAVDPGLGWLGRSAGLKGWLDLDGFIRPADMFEGSFTNFPAMQGLGSIETMSALQERFSRRMVFVGGIYQPEGAASRSESLASNEASNPSPDQASNKKGAEDMKFSAETLKLLGLAEGASQEEIERALQGRLSTPKPQEPTTTAAATPADSAKVFAELLGPALAEERVKLTASLTAEFEARDKAKAIDAVLSEAEGVGGTPGRITAAEREEFRALGDKIGPESLKKVRSRFGANAPTAAVFEPGHGVSTPISGSNLQALCDKTTEQLRAGRRAVANAAVN